MKSYRFLASVLGVLLLASNAAAHDGPPYPILVDETLAGRTISVWADPDVGIGTFYIYVTPPPAPGEATGMQVAVRPLAGRPNANTVVPENAPETSHEVRVAPDDQPYAFIAEVPFAHRGDWSVRFVADSDAANPDELALIIDVTPPGLGRLDLLWFLSPFLAVGFVWIRVASRRREMSRTED